MSFQAPITIKEVVDNIRLKRYLLPSIQRELVWDPHRIERLFDSLMRDYPIGSFLFWNVDKTRVAEFVFYEFVRNFHERDNKHNLKAEITGHDDIIGVLDGQQRLTSLYIGLTGSYAKKDKARRWDNDLAFPKRYLHLNLLKKFNFTKRFFLQFVEFVVSRKLAFRQIAQFVIKECLSVKVLEIAITAIIQ